MNLSDLTINLLFLFLPGIIGALIINTLTTHRNRQLFNFFIHAYLIGIFSYVVLHCIFFIADLAFNISVSTRFLTSFLDDQENVQVWEIFSASIVGVLLALFIVYIVAHKILYKIANKTKLSSKHGESDVWDVALSPNNVEWVNVRKDNLIYNGEIRNYSEKNNTREVLLANVRVFTDNKENELMYEMDFILFNFNPNEYFTIELYRKEDIKDERSELRESDLETTREAAERGEDAS